jgi:hypothetical protein
LTLYHKALNPTKVSTLFSLEGSRDPYTSMALNFVKKYDLYGAKTPEEIVLLTKSLFAEEIKELWEETGRTSLVNKLKEFCDLIYTGSQYFRATGFGQPLFMQNGQLFYDTQQHPVIQGRLKYEFDVAVMELYELHEVSPDSLYDFTPTSSDVAAYYQALFSSVILNGFLYFQAIGVDVFEAYKIVHKSNMTKGSPDGNHRNKQGKLLKGENYVPAREKLQELVSKTGSVNPTPAQWLL